MFLLSQQLFLKYVFTLKTKSIERCRYLYFNYLDIYIIQFKSIVKEANKDTAEKHFNGIICQIKKKKMNVIILTKRFIKTQEINLLYQYSIGIESNRSLDKVIVIHFVKFEY